MSNGSSRSPCTGPKTPPAFVQTVDPLLYFKIALANDRPLSLSAWGLGGVGTGDDVLVCFSFPVTELLREVALFVPLRL